jgi:GTPase SAR1 family protein
LKEEHSLRILGKTVLRGVFEIKKVERQEAVENYIKESFMSFIYYRVLLGWSKSSKRRRWNTSHIYRRENRCTVCEEKDHFEDLGVNGRTVSNMCYINNIKDFGFDSRGMP